MDVFTVDSVGVAATDFLDASGRTVRRYPPSQ
jgi:hypothetical protein